MADNYSENHGANIVACAEYLYNVLWECQRDVAGWKYTFLKGNRYRIPYGQPVDEGEYIGYPADINTFLCAAHNTESEFYSQQSYWEGTKIRSTYYAMDCSSFVSYCWDAPRTTTANWHELDCTCLGTILHPDDLNVLQPGDALNHAADQIGRAHV